MESTAARYTVRRDLLGVRDWLELIHHKNVGRPFFGCWTATKHERTSVFGSPGYIGTMTNVGTNYW